ncbi:LysR family transcriptional regulator [Nonomuraea typhae]|uniref:LysR substrate-binding domain-containing protein n=1 Tax=Nonomuraea typhae TaxID=2603600 RepID=UPI0012FCCD83|nr:LysR family transcriptional regulator [Nonomuraea typhae]
MLEKYELEAFLTLAEELHFGRTAARLHVTTARVSQTIKKLERRVGVPLFERSSRRVELSPVGRQLHEELRPAWELIGAAMERAAEAGRGITGTLTVAFVGAAAGQLVAGAAGEFSGRQPGCAVRIVEAQLGEVVPWLRDGVAELALTAFPMEAAGVVAGPVLVREARMLAVPAGHPFARRDGVSVEDLARVPVLRLPESVPESHREERTPRQTPAGRRITPGPVAATLHEALTLVGAGRGVFPVGAQTRRYYQRPDVAYVLLADAPPVEWGLMWRSGGGTARVLAFARAARDLLAAHR